MRHRVAFSRIGLGLMAGFLLLCSCGDEEERHRTLTFFFDGVPPLSGPGGGPALSRVNPADAAGGAPTVGWHVHTPLSNCTECHGDRQRQGFSRRVRLVAAVPTLCYKCHQEYTDLQGWVHGPVAVGECLLCHEPHKSRHESLLVKPVPDLCYGCHEPQAIHEIEGHARESYAHCNDCHEGHAGATKDLLKPGFAARFADRMLPPEGQPERGAFRPEAPGTPSGVHQTPAGGYQQPQMTAEDRYNRSIQAYHAGRFAEAREGFLLVVGSPSVPASMREMAKDYLEKIEWLQKTPQLPDLRSPR